MYYWELFCHHIKQTLKKEKQDNKTKNKTRNTTNTWELLLK